MFRKYFNLIIIVVILLLLRVTNLSLTDLEITNHQDFNLELSANTIINSPNDHNQYVISGLINKNLFSQHIITIIPDDCIQSIKVNSVPIPLLESSQESLCNYDYGLTVDLGSFLVNGQNLIQLQLDDYGGKFGIILKNSFRDPIYLFLTTSLIVTLIIEFYKYLSKVNVNRLNIGILISGLIIRLIYLSYTNYWVRNYDLDGHLEYINYLTQFYQLPSIDHCWQCYQPPLYYLLASIIVKLYHLIGIVNPTEIYYFLQCFSLIIFMGFLVVSYFTINLIHSQLKPLNSNLFIGMTMTLMTFYPSGVIHSARISNDILLYFLQSLTLYFLLKWWYHNQQLNLDLAGLFTVLSILTKSNGLIMIPVIVLTIALKIFSHTMTNNNETAMVGENNNIFNTVTNYCLRHGNDILNYCKILLLFFSGIILSLSRQLLSYNRQNLLVGNIQNLDLSLKINNKITNLILFNFNNFLQIPNIDTRNDLSGRQYFWNFMLKTSLFGEFSINNPINQELSLLLSFILLIIIVYVIAGLLTLKKKQVMLLAPLIIYHFLAIISLLSFRLKYPYSCSNDFRYIFPVIIAVSIFYSLGLSNWRRFPIWTVTGYGIGLIFAMLVMVFFIVPISGELILY